VQIRRKIIKKASIHLTAYRGGRLLLALGQTIFLQQESYRQHQDEDYMHTHKFFDRPKTAFCPCLGNSGKRNSILIEKIRFHFFSFLSRITEKRRKAPGVFR